MMNLITRCTTLFKLVITTHLLSGYTLAQVTTGQLGNAGQVLNNPPGAAYIAELVSGPITGRIIVISSPGTGTDFSVKFQGLPSNAGPFGETYHIVRTTKKRLIALAYHIHVEPVLADGNCTKTLAHLDPYIRGEVEPCLSSRPETCQVGDLSGKHGKIIAQGDQQLYETSYTDPYVSLIEGQGSFFGNRSFVIHLPDKTRIACANFVSADIAFQDMPKNKPPPTWPPGWPWPSSSGPKPSPSSPGASPTPPTAPPTSPVGPDSPNTPVGPGPDSPGSPNTPAGPGPVSPAPVSPGLASPAPAVPTVPSSPNGPNFPSGGEGPGWGSGGPGWGSGGPDWGGYRPGSGSGHDGGGYIGGGYGGGWGRGGGRANGRGSDTSDHSASLDTTSSTGLNVDGNGSKSNGTAAALGSSGSDSPTVEAAAGRQAGPQRSKAAGRASSLWLLTTIVLTLLLLI